MEIEKLIEAVRLCGSTPKVDQCKRCVYWAAGDMSRCIPNMTGDAATAIETLRTDFVRTMKERNATIQYLREFDVCAGCKYYKNGVCRNDKSSLCTDENDLYEFAMPEDSNDC